MKINGHNDVDSSSMLNSIESSEGFDNYMETTDDQMEKSNSKPRRMPTNMLPSQSPENSKWMKNSKKYPITRKSLNMRGDPENISQSVGMFQNRIDSDSMRGMSPTLNKIPDKMSQRSGPRINMKFQKSETKSQTSSFKGKDVSGFRNIRTSNVRLKEIEGESQENVERGSGRNEGVRTPKRIQGRSFSRKGSESSLSRLKVKEGSAKVPSRNRYDKVKKKKDADEITFLRNKVNKMKVQLNSGKASDSKLRKEVDELKKKNATLREHLKEAKKKNEALAAEKKKVRKVTSGRVEVQRAENKIRKSDDGVEHDDDQQQPLEEVEWGVGRGVEAEAGGDRGLPEPNERQLHEEDQGRAQEGRTDGVQFAEPLRQEALEKARFEGVSFGTEQQRVYASDEFCVQRRKQFAQRNAQSEQHSAGVYSKGGTAQY